MLHRSLLVFAAVSPLLLAQSAVAPPEHGPQPVYRVTIVERTTPAINYGYRAEPTKIDFRGTPLLPDAHGEATVESKRGATLVDAHFDRVPVPSRFGAGYLTYVVWAISPEGRAQNLGELVLNGDNKGKLVASTPMQAFALIVTAEPYFSVSRPSDAVVMENQVRADTVGKVEQVNAKYELLPRQPFTLDASQPAIGGGRQVSQKEYEALTALYQAQNAINIATSVGAAKYAPELLTRAQKLLDQARANPLKDQSKEVVAEAREAAQAAEDARTVALRRVDEERMAEKRRQDEQAAQQREEVARAQQQAEAERAAAVAAERQAQAHLVEAQREHEQQAQQAAAAARPALEARLPAPADDQKTTALAKTNRARLTASLRAQGLQTLDSPRGVVAMIPAAMLNGNPDRVRAGLASLASMLRSYHTVQIDVEGYTGAGGSPTAAQADANIVSALLTSDGIPANEVSAHGMGDARPLASNKTAAGREANRRVEIVINSDSIGNTPIWDNSYTLATR